MVYVAALSFKSYEDFEVCNKYLEVQPGGAETSFDGMFTVTIETERRMPKKFLGIFCTLIVTTDEGESIFVRVVTGTRTPVSDDALHTNSSCKQKV